MKLPTYELGHDKTWTQESFEGWVFALLSFCNQEPRASCRQQRLIRLCKCTGYLSLWCTTCVDVGFAVSQFINKKFHFNNKITWLSIHLSCLMTKPAKWHVHPTKTQISLGIHPVWSESSLCTQWVAKDPNFLHGDSKDSDQTGQMPRLIQVFAGHTVIFSGFVMRWLICLQLLFYTLNLLDALLSWKENLVQYWRPLWPSR